MLHQRVVGVIENMSYLDTGSETGAGQRLEIFGSGGAQKVATTLSGRFGYDVPVLGEIPLDPRLREGGDTGTPIVVTHPDSQASQALQEVADQLTGRSRGLAGMQLGLSPAGR
jgi:ATP-binding protein involved in chromosome partitioning